VVCLVRCVLCVVHGMLCIENGMELCNVCNVCLYCQLHIACYELCVAYSV